MDELTQELNTLLRIKKTQLRRKKLEAYQQKLASLTFLDPACGSGNFLTETYLSLRKLENKALAYIQDWKDMGEIFNPVRVSIHQFYGIEINDFAVSVAKTALWIAEAQMLKETEDIVGTDLDFFPLRTSAILVEGNALRMEWGDIVPPGKLNYIMGNPPFVGARLMDPTQKEDVLHVFGKDWKNVGNLDYVCCWYKKAADFMKNTPIRAALVSTNSVTQGEQVATLWKPLFEEGLHFDFAHTTFRWDSEATLKAHVHCVIIGFSYVQDTKKIIFTLDHARNVNQINGYLLDMPPVFVESRTKPTSNVPQISIGNQPIDGGNYLFTQTEMEEFINKEPAAKPYFRPWYGAEEFINRKPRYCLWLGNCSPNILRGMPLALKRVENVKNLRLESKRTSTLKLAQTPTRFQVETMPSSNYIIIPRVTSERRVYVPIGFLEPINLCSDAVHIVPNANLYHFGILTSNAHNAWMRVVAGRLKSDYRYSKDIVYNNFPWPAPTEEQKQKIKQTAQAILDVRALYPNSSLADLYDDLTMPIELRKAHQANDRAVLAAYGLPKNIDERELVAHLFKLYQQLTQAK